jgi:Tfp pilus assembly protein PilX
MTPQHRRTRPPRAQRGIASLIIVMVLFFIVSMVAAYASRNLIFEQRTSANQYVSTQAMEAAEAGIEWAIGMLNHGRIDANCVSSAVTTDTTFRERHLFVDAADAFRLKRLQAGSPAVPAQATCVWDGNAWDCTCPTAAAGVVMPTAPAGAGTFPAFRVRFVNASTAQYLNVVRVEANGCTRLDDACLSFTGQGVSNEGRTVARALLAMVPALPRPPAAALTAGGSVNLTGGAPLALFNTDDSVGGITIRAAGSVNIDTARLFSLPGTPGSQSLRADDLSLPATADAFFADTFNMWPLTQRQQPATITLDCDPVACDAATVRDLAALNPGRPIWLQGNLDIDSAGDIGSVASPVLLVVEGALDFNTDVTIHGLVYVRSADWVTAGTGTVRGAVVAQGIVSGTGTPRIVYDRALLESMRVNSLNAGSFVRVPGGWRDY